MMKQRNKDWVVFKDTWEKPRSTLLISRDAVCRNSRNSRNAGHIDAGRTLVQTHSAFRRWPPEKGNHRGCSLQKITRNHLLLTRAGVDGFGYNPFGYALQIGLQDLVQFTIFSSNQIPFRNAWTLGISQYLNLCEKCRESQAGYNSIQTI